MKDRKVVFSGVQPSGIITLGNYLGAIKNWVKMQESDECLFCIVDLHAITIYQDPKILTQNILNVAAIYVSSGLDPQKSIIFQQSSIAEHLKLSWILGNHTSIGWLSRMTQFKNKAGKNKETASLGLYSYPILMAADILLYNADLIPVGEDQIQHIELCRDIVGAFNRQYQIDYFKMPKALINQNVKRIMSLRNAKKKMSKSDPSDATRINIFDSNELIGQKIKKATTDSFKGIWFDEKNRPEVSNLLNIYSACSGNSMESSVQELKNCTTSQFKSKLTEVIISSIGTIRDKALKMLKEKGVLVNILKEGQKKAKELASTNLKKVYEIVGLSVY
ncbi:MAG: tryptophan--tRNA ligase [Candidatus Midichloria sp.]|nr:MAG: tryptophan--tRNA ligase [Candidatus Midichloria sp.]